MQHGHTGKKGLFRIIGGYFNSLSGFNFAEIVERTKVLTGLQKDPFDTFDFQLEIHKKYNLKPIYFILFADYGFNDKNIPVQSRKFQTLIKSLADYAEVDKRSKAVIQNLVDIRTSEIAYKIINGKYTSSFDTLIDFLKTGEIPVVNIIPDPEDTTFTKTIRDTIG